MDRSILCAVRGAATLAACPRALGTLVLSALLACGGGAPARDASRATSADSVKDIVIGMPWPWEMAKQTRYKDGVALALEEVNAGGGIGGHRLRLMQVDDRGSVDSGRVVAQRLTQDHSVVAIVGHLQSFVTMPAAAIYDLAGIPLVAPFATDPQLTSLGYKNVFRTTFTDIEAGQQLADYAAKRGYKRAAIYYIRTAYGRILANAFEERATERGITTVARQSYDGGSSTVEQSVDGTLRAWKNLQFDVVFLAGEPEQAASFIASARRRGIQAAVIGGDALGVTPFLTMAGHELDGTVVASVFHPDSPRAATRTFAAKFKARFGTVPDPAAAQGYDAVRLLAEAIRRAGSASPDKVATALHGLRAWSGATGDVTFDQHGDIVGSVVTKMIVRDGHFEYLPDDATVADLANAPRRPRAN